MESPTRCSLLKASAAIGLAALCALSYAGVIFLMGWVRESEGTRAFHMQLGNRAVMPKRLVYLDDLQRTERHMQPAHRSTPSCRILPNPCAA